MAYIYKIINDVNNKLYIGKTEFSIEKRFKEHCQDALKRRNEKRPLYSAMRKYGFEHFHIELIEETDVPEEREKYWIKFFGTYENGYNATRGGDGKPRIDYDLVIAEYEKCESCKEVAERLHIDAGQVSTILKEKGIHLRTRPRGKKVNMYSLDEELIQTFDSLGDSARFLIETKNLSSTNERGIVSHISEACRGKRKTCYEYIWRYVE